MYGIQKIDKLDKWLSVCREENISSFVLFDVTYRQSAVLAKIENDKFYHKVPYIRKIYNKVDNVLKIKEVSVELFEEVPFEPHGFIKLA